MQRELSRPRKLAMWDLQRTMRGASTPRKSFTPMLPVSLLHSREMNGENNQHMPRHGIGREVSHMKGDLKSTEGSDGSYECRTHTKSTGKASAILVIQ